MKTGIFVMVVAITVVLTCTFFVVALAQAGQSSMNPFTLLSTSPTSAEPMLARGGHYGGGGHYMYRGGGHYMHGGYGYRHYRRGFYGYGGWYGGPIYTEPYYNDDCWQWNGNGFIWVCP
jgi:hypothetical protein